MDKWVPQEKQKQALVCLDFEIFYGGSRGGGKTDTGQAWLLYDKDHPLYRALVIRRNADDLRDWVDRAHRMYAGTKAEFSGNPVEIRFPKGGIIRTGHLKDTNAYMKYQGHEYHRMLIEEASQIPTEQNYLMLLASCRSTVPELKPQVFITANPDGPGFLWLRRRFRLKGVPNEPIKTIDKQTGLSRIFIPARLQDNKYLMRDPQYKAFLDGLPDGLREAWRDGSWDDPVIAGAYYTNELLQARREGRIGIWPINKKYPVYSVWDLGISDAMAVGLFQRYDKKLFLVGYYENEGFGMPHYFSYLQQWQRDNQIIFGKHFAPHDITVRELSSGKTRQQVAREMNFIFEVIPKLSIADGIEQVRLLFPRLMINESTCEQFTYAIRQYRKEKDEKANMYKDNPVHDWTSHAADMLRGAALIEDKMELLTPEPQLPERFERISEFEPEYGDDERPPHLQGVDIGTMGHGPAKVE